MLKVIKQIADGSDYETEDPFEITVKLTPAEGEAAFYLDPDKTIADYIEVDTEDTILLNGPTITGENNAGTVITITLTLAGRGFFTIKNLHEGTAYEVTEEPGTGWQQQGDINYSNLDQTIVKKQLDTATITNEEVETSLIIEKIFDGSLVDSMTDEQKQNITFKVTGPNNFNETFTYGVDVADDYTWSDGVHRDACTWMDSMLTITKIEPGTYTVTEQHHDLASIFGTSVDPTYTHTWSYRVNGGTPTTEPDPDQVSAEVIAGQSTQVVITNTYDLIQYGSLYITKKVTVNGQETNTKQADGTYVFSIAGPDSETVVKCVQITVKDGLAVSYKVAEGTAVSVNWDSIEAVTFAADAETREAVVSDLAAGDYIITETEVAGMTTKVSGGKDSVSNAETNSITVTVTAGETVGANAKATFTNNKNLINLTIIKIDETTRSDTSQTKKLPNAKFKLYRYSVPVGGSTGTYTVYPDDTNSEKTTSGTEGDSYGTLTFESLPDGCYMISETEPPAGYVKTQNNDIYFDIVNGVITRYDKGYAEISRAEISEETNTVNITYSKSEKTFTVGNNPGATLPNTGGPGTRRFTILGSILILGVGVLLWRRRRLI